MFSETLKRNFLDEAKRLDIPSFLDQVQKYKSLDDALADLPSEYLEFYMNNERTVKKALKNIFEGIETPGYLGWSNTEDDTVKVIKYKGEMLHLRYDSEYHHWVPEVAFRKITEAVRYGKTLIDDEDF